jgi:DNA invertase Pin-like site-specific DNA recombinase
MHFRSLLWGASGLVVTKLDRLSRSVVDFRHLLEWFSEADATLIALDLGIDTSSPGERPVANVFASVAELEREVIGARTRKGLQAARGQGQANESAGGLLMTHSSMSGSMGCVPTA